jgi:hypothetical protein
VLATLIAAAEAGAEPSKVPFYIFGGVLAAWAVIVSAIGIRAHDSFPPSLSARRGVMAISVVLVLCAMGSAVLTS